MSSDNNNPAASDDPKIFSAVITPHRSLGPKGFLIFMLCLGGLSFVSGVAFVVMGAWPVCGFFGLDVLRSISPSAPITAVRAPMRR